MVYDIAIIGAGVVGTQIARNFSKYDLKVALLEPIPASSMPGSTVRLGPGWRS